MKDSNVRPEDTVTVGDGGGMGLVIHTQVDIDCEHETCTMSEYQEARSERIRTAGPISGRAGEAGAGEAKAIAVLDRGRKCRTSGSDEGEECDGDELHLCK